MSHAKEYFTALKNVLKIEMKEDAKIYDEELSKQSIQERKEIGITWYPLHIKSEYYGFAERLHIEVERKYETDSPNVFYSGDKVRVFSNQQHSNVKEDFIEGVITASRGNQVTIQLMKDESINSLISIVMKQCLVLLIIGPRIIWIKMLFVYVVLFWVKKKRSFVPKNS